jgi:hypothetical protein
MEVNGFNNTQAYISEYTPQGWDAGVSMAATAYNTGMYSLQLDDVTSFGQFAVLNKSVPTYFQDIKNGIPFTIYHNPAIDLIIISVPEPGNNTMMKIFDVSGNEILSQEISNPVTPLNISGLASGCYFASINNSATKVFIKK